VVELHDLVARGEIRAGRAVEVVVSVDLLVFEDLPLRHPAEELLPGEEEVVKPRHLPGPGLPGGAGDHLAQIGHPLQNLFQHRGLAHS
jgi:hypothetical protein